jgi:hypothetical protein
VIRNRLQSSWGRAVRPLSLIAGALLLVAPPARAGTAAPSSNAAETKPSDPGGGTAASPNPGGSFGLDAPLLEVDRFSDRAATRLKRSLVPGLPGPNQPIHLDDAPFLVRLSAPGGASAACYDLDVRPAEPARFYVFYDVAGNYILTQFPVVDVAPGDPGYSDLWDIWKVTVPVGFPQDNSIRDLETLERMLKDPASGIRADRTGALLNGPIVPEGSTAQHKAERREGAATMRYVWYRGKRAPYLYFEQKLRIQGDQAPVGEMILQTPPSAPAPALPGVPSPALSTVPLGISGTLRIDVLPGESGYSPLRRLLGPDGKPLLEGAINCPVAGS